MASGLRANRSTCIVLSVAIAYWCFSCQQQRSAQTFSALLSGRHRGQTQQRPRHQIALRSQAHKEVAAPPLRPGDELRGIIISEEPLVVDIGRNRERVLIPDPPHARGHHDVRALRIGDEVQVWIKRIEAKRLVGTLSREEVPSADAYDKFIEAGETEKYFSGVVVELLPAFALLQVSLPNGTVGLCRLHISQIREAHVADIQRELRVGQELQVRVMQKEQWRDGVISVSCRSRPEYVARDITYHEEFAALKDRGGLLSGTVDSIKNFGAFIRVLNPDTGRYADGLLPASRVPGLHKWMREGQPVMVQIVDVDLARGRMALTIPRRARGLLGFLGLMEDKVWMKGQVLSKQRNRALVRVMHPVTGYQTRGVLRVSDMDKGVDGMAKLGIGKEVDVHICDVDLETSKMWLSTVKQEP